MRYLFNQSLGFMNALICINARHIFVRCLSLPLAPLGRHQPERLSPKFRVPCLGLLRKATGEELEGAGLLPAGLPRPTRVRGIRTWEEHALAKSEAGCHF